MTGSFTVKQTMRLKDMFLSILFLAVLSFSCDAKITGAFFQLNSGNTGKPRIYWQTELDLMHKIGMDTLIIQYSATESDTFYNNSQKSIYSFEGPFQKGSHDIIIEKGSLIIYEIETTVPFSYELKGAPPLPFFGDDGYKLKDGIDDNLNSAVVWSEADEQIIVTLVLENKADSISLITGNIAEDKDLPPPCDVDLDGKIAAFSQEGDYHFLLQEATKRQIKVWLGLKLSDSWWSGNLDLEKDCLENLELAGKLIDLYGNYEGFYGFYIPHELYPSGTTLPQNYLHFFRDLTVGLQRLGKPVSIAPYFGGNMMPKSHGKYWEAFFKEVPLDVLMLQDGVGCHRLPLEQIPKFYSEVYSVCKDYGVLFWSDLEVFDQLKGDSFNAVPALFSRVEKQIKTQIPVVDKIVIFDWPHYMSPNRDPQAKALYEAYATWLKSQSKTL